MPPVDHLVDADVPIEAILARSANPWNIISHS